MTDIPTRTFDFETTEGMLLRALCVLIDRQKGHVEITAEEMEAVTGQFAMGTGDGSLVLTTLRGDYDVQH